MTLTPNLNTTPSLKLYSVSTIKRKFLSLIRIGGQGRILFLGAFILLSLIRLSLKLVPFKVLINVLERLQSKFLMRQSLPAQRPVSQLRWAVNASTHYMPRRAKCLARALTLQVLMQYYGYQPELRIGVAKTDAGMMEAHAWLEYQGSVVIGNLPDLGRYSVMPALEGVNL
jgi:hypothetical protein